VKGLAAKAMSPKPRAMVVIQVLQTRNKRGLNEDPSGNSRACQRRKNKQDSEQKPPTAKRS
jgi:hypothetical protein